MDAEAFLVDTLPGGLIPWARLLPSEPFVTDLMKAIHVTPQIFFLPFCP